MTLSRAAMLQEALDGPRRALVRLPDTVVRNEAWVKQIITPSLRSGGLNEVMYFAASEAQAEQLIDDTLARFDVEPQVQLRFRWSVGPDSTPTDLAERLARRGLVSEWVSVLGCDCDQARSSLQEPPGQPAVEVVTPATLAEYSQVMAEGWGMPVEPMHRVNQVIFSEPHHRLYVAREPGGEAAAVGSVVYSTHGAYLMGAVVLERFRGRGHYSALVDRRLEDATADGKQFVYTHAREVSSAPRLLRRGFERWYRFQSFSAGPRAAPPEPPARHTGV